MNILFPLVKCGEFYFVIKGAFMYAYGEHEVGFALFCIAILSLKITEIIKRNDML